MASNDLAGKVVVVTGASTGLGLETARKFAERGATIVIANRHAARGEAALEDVKRSTGNAKLELFAVDLLSMDDTRRFAAELRGRHPRIDVLINNAGVVPDRKVLSRDGLDAAFAVNILAPYVLTQELLEPLKAAAPSRVVMIAGASSPIDLDDLQYERAFDPWKSYQRSKHGLLLILSELARRSSPLGITVTAAAPGIMRTAQWGSLPLSLRALFATVLRALISTPADGARAPLFCATSPDAKPGLIYDQKGKQSTYGVPSGWPNPPDAPRLYEYVEHLARTKGAGTTQRRAAEGVG
jgi:retinol dehydrogenase 12